MTPLFACFPVIMTFAALALLALIVIATGMARSEPEDEKPQSAAAAANSDYATGPPPWWVVALMFVAVAAVMLVLAWFWPE